MSKKIPVCVYCRVSTSQDSQTLSYEMQKSYYEAYVNSNPNWELKHIFADRGISGTILDKNRIEFHKMLNDCGVEVIQTANKFSVETIENVNPKYKLIVVKDEKRFARNSNISEIINKLLDKGVGVYFETLGINTLEKNDVSLKFLFNMSEEYSRNLSKNLKISYERAHLKNPKVLGHYPPFGYKFGVNEKNERTLIPINDEYVKIVNEIFDLYILGNGYRVIGQYVKDKGFKTTNGKEMRKDTISNILSNEKYMGYIQVIRHTPETINKYGHIERSKMNYDLIKSDKVVPMVSEEKFQLAKRKLEEKPIFQSSKGRGSNYCKSKYAKKIYCLNCGGLYYKTNDSRGDSVYVCRTKRENLGSAKSCKSPYISEEFIDEYLDSLLKDNNFARVEKEKINAQIQYFTFYKYALIATFFEDRNIELITDLKNQINALKEEQDNLMDSYKSLPPSVLERKVNRIQEEIDLLQSSLDKEEFSVSEFKKELALINGLIKDFENYNFDKVKTHSDILQLIDLEITPNNPNSTIRQKRNDCRITHRSIYEDEYNEIEYITLNELTLSPNPIYEKRLLEEQYFTNDEMQKLDFMLADIF